MYRIPMLIYILAIITNGETTDKQQIYLTVSYNFQWFSQEILDLDIDIEKLMIKINCVIYSNVIY